MTDTSRVLFMNTSHAHSWEGGLPFPARQQLGDPDSLAHKFPLAGPQELGNPESGGHGVLIEPTYVHPVTPVLSPTGREDDEPDQYGSAALQRGETGRNRRTIGASQSSARPPTVVAERSASDVRSPSASEVSEVPDGSTSDVLTWVGDDSGRARAAIEVERKKPQPRRSLITQLSART